MGLRPRARLARSWSSAIIIIIIIIIIIKIKNSVLKNTEKETRQQLNF